MKPVTVRMNGRCERFDEKITVLEKKGGWSDVVVAWWPDDSFLFSSSPFRGQKDARGRKMNICTLTTEQTAVLRAILKIDFKNKFTQNIAGNNEG